jgi:hypothetical protein
MFQPAGDFLFCLELLKRFDVCGMVAWLMKACQVRHYRGRSQPARYCCHRGCEHMRDRWGPLAELPGQSLRLQSPIAELLQLAGC